MEREFRRLLGMPRDEVFSSLGFWYEGTFHTPSCTSRASANTPVLSDFAKTNLDSAADCWQAPGAVKFRTLQHTFTSAKLVLESLIGTEDVLFAPFTADGSLQITEDELFRAASTLLTWKNSTLQTADVLTVSAARIFREAFDELENELRCLIQDTRVKDLLLKSINSKLYKAPRKDLVPGFAILRTAFSPKLDLYLEAFGRRVAPAGGWITAPIKICETLNANSSAIVPEWYALEVIETIATFVLKDGMYFTDAVNVAETLARSK